MTKKFSYFLYKILLTLDKIFQLVTKRSILNWFKDNNVEFISSIPSSESEIRDNIFEKQKKGDKISRFLAQFFAIFSPFGNEGGLFLFIGKKK